MVGPLELNDASNGSTTAAKQAWDAVLAYVTAAPAGTRLPAERALSERLGVSRSTLRSALARLELLGHVEVKHGSGIVVRRPDVSDVLRLVTLVDGASPADALAIRKLVEPALAGDAAGRGVAAAAALEAAQDEVAFHSALAAAAGNELAGQLVDVLVRLSGPVRLPAELHAAQHAAITAAVAVRDARSAAGATTVHLDALNAY
ncbi:MAG TPA: GntR family transcriptional regulator [Trueperaceae bacterium]